MERMPQPVSKHYRAVRLYSDDIEEIVKLLQEHCRDVSIEAGGYKVQCVDDLKDLKQPQVHDFKITAWAGGTPTLGTMLGGTYLALTLERADARFYMSKDDSVTTQGVFSRIDMILQRRMPRFGFLARPFLTKLAVGVGTGILFGDILGLLISNAVLGPKVPQLVGLSDIISGVLGIILIVYGLIFSRMSVSLVYLFPAHDRSSFWARNKEGIIRDVIVGVVVFLLTSPLFTLLGYLLGVNAKH